MSFLLTPAAKDDLLKIWSYLAVKEGSDLADRIQDRILDEIRRLAQSPGIGHRRNDLTDRELLFWNVFRYLVIYRQDTNPVVIVRVIHGAQDIENLLDEA